MGDKALWALLGGVGGGVSLALLSLLTKMFNPQGNYSVAVLLSIFVFALTCAFVMGAVVLNIPGARSNLNWLLGGLLLSAAVAGALFPWGTFGFWLGFLSIGVIIPISLLGFSTRALQSCFGGIAGLVVGGVAATLWSMRYSLVEASLGSQFISDFISYGLMTYGLTLGLLLFTKSV